ncbi:D-alanyl-D-alanine carboxypeptidase [Candidatus Kaiserbacteria bacterium]|nr:D-alanyl-D-alanine carboxypeptidase [Candidatus Kaiserbacteria bacterium]
MEKHIDRARAGSRLLRLFGFGVLSIVFLLGVSLAWGFLTSVPRSPAQSAAAAEVLSERAPFSALSLRAKGAFVVDTSTGTILYTSAPDAQLPLASLTKVALALVAAEVVAPDTAITIPRDVPASSSTGKLPAGSRFRAGDLISWMLVGSSNDAAEILAQAIDDPLTSRYRDAPVGRAAVWRMNDLARALGLTHTYFLNPSGLDESPTQSGAYGSARDVAALFAYAVQTDLMLFADTSQDSVTITSLEGKAAMSFNTDKVLAEIPGLLMGKTGYTDLAGGNLAIAFDASPNHRIVAVVLGSTQEGRFEDMRAIASAARDAFSVAR